MRCDANRTRGRPRSAKTAWAAVPRVLYAISFMAVAGSLGLIDRRGLLALPVPVR